ncbi:MAG: hypothetical protein ACLPXZ_05390 [Mycobacterium sp.]
MSHSELLPIPPIDTATDPVHSPADLRERWRALMGPLGFGQRLLWIGFLGDDRRLMKTMTQMPIDAVPTPCICRDLMSKLQFVVDGMLWDINIALLLTGPGRGGISPADRQWATSLTDAAVEFEVPLLPIFRANDEAILHVDPA